MTVDTHKSGARWSRRLCIAIATAVCTMLLPSAAVVSDVSHTMLVFEPFPQGARTRPAETPGTIWLAEESESQDWYSNGLLVDNTFRTRNERRFFQMLDRGRNMEPTADWKSEPVGLCSIRRKVRRRRSARSRTRLCAG